MQRFTAAAIILVGLTAPVAQGFAADAPNASPPQKVSVPAEQLLADMSAPPLPGPPGNGPDDNRQGPPPGMMGQMPPPPMGPPIGHGPGMPGGPMERTWGLFFDQHDKNLSVSDVQTLAQALLLIHGNHTWKVADVTQSGDGSVTFAYTTGDGSIIARFSVESHSGRLTRIG